MNRDRVVIVFNCDAIINLEFITECKYIYY